jgi:hypothetical protein
MPKTKSSPSSKATSESPKKKTQEERAIARKEKEKKREELDAKNAFKKSLVPWTGPKPHKFPKSMPVRNFIYLWKPLSS